MKELISQNLRQLYGRIAEACETSERDTDDITIVAVTKTHPAGVIRHAIAAGLRDIGESRIQEAEPKILEIDRQARFHLIGHLQSNKVKKAVELFDIIQSVDSLRLANEISRRAAEIERTIECLIEVNCSGEEQKQGVEPDNCLELLRQVDALDNIRLTGLMTIAPYVDDEYKIRAAFARCRKLWKQGQDIVGEEFDTLSMGMTSDFEAAISECATMIRIGSALFGPRTF